MARLKTTQRPLKLSGRKADNRQAEIQGLSALGFTRHEAMAYLALLETNPATAYEISKRGALTKATVYAALDSLAHKGAVQPVTENPVRYAPVEPDRLFGQIANTMTVLCRDLSGRLAARTRQQRQHYVWTLAGDAAIEREITEMIDRAKKQVWIRGPHHLLSRFLVPLQRAARRGVHVLTILFGDETSAHRFAFGRKSTLYLHEGSGEMLAVGERQIIVAADFVETLLAHFGERSEAAHTRSSAVVFIAETLFRHEVYLAEIMKAFGPSIEKRFGKALLSLRARYLPPELRRALAQRLAADRQKPE